MEEGITLPDVSIPLIKGDKGDKGDAGKISSLQITMLASTATPTVTNNGTVYDAKYVLGIPKGTGIASAEINEDSELVVTLTDGTELNLGVVVGSSVSSVYFTEDYDLMIELTDGTEINAGNIETLLDSILDSYYTKAETDSAISTATQTLSNFLLPIMARNIQLSINPTTYVLTASLQNTSAQVISTASIDLPLESMVVSGSYDSVNKKVVLTLQSGSTVEFSVADLVAGLQTEITSSNKLSADLVDDTSTTNKFVTSSEKTKISNAITATDYATSDTGGVIKTSNGYGTAMTSGKLFAVSFSYSDYGEKNSNLFISKGTLENVLDAKIGDIATVLDTIQGEVI